MYCRTISCGMSSASSRRSPSLSCAASGARGDIPPFIARARSQVACSCDSALGRPASSMFTVKSGIQPLTRATTILGILDSDNGTFWYLLRIVSFAPFNIAVTIEGAPEAFTPDRSGKSTTTSSTPEASSKNESVADGAGASAFENRARRTSYLRSQGRAEPSRQRLGLGTLDEKFRSDAVVSSVSLSLVRG